MDIEFALSQMWDLLFFPKKVYAVYFRSRKATRRYYARDDPAFLVVLCVFVLVSSVAYLVSLRVSDAGIWLYQMLCAVPIQFLFMGVLLASLGWFVAHQFLRDASSPAADEPIEWPYAFDIHCNAYFVYFMISSVLQFVLLPVLYAGNLFSTFLSICLYFAAFSMYFYVTFLGYLELSFLRSQQLFMYPVVVVAFVCFLLLVLQVNPTVWVVDLYY